LFGEQHHDTAASFSNVGNAYGELGDYKKNLEYKEKAPKLRREILGDKHPATILSVSNLVSLLANMNRRPQAFQLPGEFLSQLPTDHIRYDELKKLEHNLLSQTIRPGFRQPSNRSQRRKRKKNKRR
jgi:tetratricopeptide (TPR) repeat protein